jgi:hypothetical protein
MEFLELTNYEIDARPYGFAPFGFLYKARHVPTKKNATIAFTDSNKRKSMGNVVMLELQDVKWPVQGAALPLHELRRWRLEEKYLSKRCILCPGGQSGKPVCQACHGRVVKKEARYAKKLWLLKSINLNGDIISVIVAVFFRLPHRVYHSPKK